MNVITVFKWGRSPDESFVYDDGSSKLLRDRLVPSDDDAAAVVCAREFAEAHGCQPIAVTMGNGDIAWAAARGAANTVSSPDGMPTKDEADAVQVLASAIAAAGNADVIFMGDNAYYAGVTGAVAAALGLPFVGGVQSIEADAADASHVIVHRKSGKVEQTIRVTLPALIGIAAVEQEKSVPSIKQMLAAKKAPVANVDVPTLRECAVQETAHRCPEFHRAQIFEGSAAEAVTSLVEALNADGVLPAKA